MKVKSLKISKAKGNLSSVDVVEGGKVWIPSGAGPALWKVKNKQTAQKGALDITVTLSGSSGTKAKIELEADDKMALEATVELSDSKETVRLVIGSRVK